MKKLLIGVLALTLAASMGATAFAETNDGTKSTTADVNGVYAEGQSSQNIVAVDVTWDEMRFDFTEGKKTWNPNTHEVEQEKGTWTESPKTVIVTNHSNVEINTAFAFHGEGDVTGKFDKEILILRTARGTTMDSIPTAQTSFSITGGSITQTGKVGTITVTVTVPQATVVSTEAELRAALQSDSTTNANIRLANDITLSERLILDSSGGTTYRSDCVIDLNGFALSSNNNQGTICVNNLSITFKNGTIENTGISDAMSIRNDATVKLQDCTLKAVGYSTVYIENARNVIAENCTILCENSQYQAIKVGKSVLTFCGSTVVTGTAGQIDLILDTSKDAIVCQIGTYNFNPSEYCTDESIYTVTDNGDGTWTVAAK